MPIFYFVWLTWFLLNFRDTNPILIFDFKKHFPGSFNETVCQVLSLLLPRSGKENQAILLLLFEVTQRNVKITDTKKVSQDKKF